MNIIASIQARMGSSRLPGKVFKTINGKPMLLWQVERLRHSKFIKDIVVATTTCKSDNILAEFCLENGISVYRGSENDVLGRIAGLIKHFSIDIHVECFGDSPLIDPQIIDEYVNIFLERNDLEFISNSIRTTYPPGAEVIIYKGATLLEAEKLVDIDDPFREHVSIHIYKNPDIFKCKNITAPDNLNYPELFLEVDTEEDFEVVKTIICHFEKLRKPYYSLRKIIDYMLNNPELAKTNQKIERRWKKFRE